MRVLIFGANGMLGHKVYQACRERFDTWAALRGNYSRYNLFDSDKITPAPLIGASMAAAKPDVVINCLGVVKQRTNVSTREMHYFNSVFPHRLAVACAPRGIYLIHISTDCVFSGRQGNYSETDRPDPVDQYGWSKLLGELHTPNCLTLRTSIIGREMHRRQGLLEWLISQRGKEVRGYTQALFTGMTTIALAQILVDLVAGDRRLWGLHHVGTAPLTKYILLGMLDSAYHLGVTVLSDSSAPIVWYNRCLDSRRFYRVTGLTKPKWQDMLRELEGDPTPYEEWRAL